MKTQRVHEMVTPEIIVAIIGASTTVVAAIARAVVAVRARRGKKRTTAGMHALETQLRSRGSGGHQRRDVAGCIAADACLCVLDAVRHGGSRVAEDALARIRMHALGEADERVVEVVTQRVEEYARAIQSIGASGPGAFGASGHCAPRSVAIHTIHILERLLRMEVLACVAERGIKYAGLTMYSAEHHRRAEELAGFVDVMRRLGVTVGVCVVEHRASGAFVVYADERAPVELGAGLRASFDEGHEDENAIAESIVAQWTSNERAAEIAEFRLKRARTVLVMLRAEPREFTAAAVDDATTELARLIHSVYENEHTLIVRCDEASRVTGIVCSGPRAARAARGATGDKLGELLDAQAGLWRGEACTSSRYAWGTATFVLVTLTKE